MAVRDTKERILDAAERLFGERGFVGTSTRAVTSGAGVNLAAVHYHFGSKEALLRAVIDRRVAPINQERLKRLDRLEARVGDDPPGVEAIFDTYIAPALELEQDMERAGTSLRTIVGRLYSEPLELVQSILQEEFGDVARRYVAALTRALPDLAPNELRWRFQFAVAVMTYVLSNSPRIAPAPLRVAPEPPRATVERMVAFLSSAMRVPHRPEV